MNVRLRLTKYLRRVLLPAAKPPAEPKALPRVPIRTSGLTPAFVTQAAPARSQQAKGVRLVDNQGGCVFAGEGCEVSQRGRFAIHAKRTRSRVLPPSGGARERSRFLADGDVEMPVEAGSGTRKPAGIDDACVIGMVTQNKVARCCQGGKNAEVGLVARRKISTASMLR